MELREEDIARPADGKNHDIPLGNHEIFAAQEVKNAVAAPFESHARPHEAVLAEVYDRVSTQTGTLDTIAKLGICLKAIQLADPRFAGRAIKNITNAVKVARWISNCPMNGCNSATCSCSKTHDEKKAMSEDMRQPITVDMVIQEINRYGDKSDNVAIEGAVREMQRMEEA